MPFSAPLDFDRSGKETRNLALRWRRRYWPLMPTMPDREALKRAVTLLAEGKVGAIPTETVYGLAGDAENGEAVARIFEAKGRPQFNPLLLHVSTRAMAERFAIFDTLSDELATKFWPGPLSLVLPLKARHRIHPLVSAGLDTVAVRMPHEPMRSVIAALGRPLAAPSANTSGRISPTSARAVRDDLGDRIAFVLDSGATSVGLESTIVKVEGEVIRLLRPGGVAAEEIEAATGRLVERVQGEATIEAPGMMASHYAPDAHMRLNAEAVETGEALLGFGPVRARGHENARSFLNLSNTGDLREAAVNLFAFMQALDAGGARMIAVEPIPDHGLGLAINDRLMRAAAPRA